MYCLHDRFLLYTRMTADGRVAITLMLSFLIYGSFELAAQLSSVVLPALTYAIIGLFVIALPLRHFQRTCTAAVAIWIVLASLALAFQFTSTRFRIIVATIFLVVVITFATSIGAARASSSQRITEGPYGRFSGLVASILTGAGGSAALCLAVFLDDYAWGAEEVAMIWVAFVATIVFLIAGIMAAIAGGIAYGPSRIRLDVVQIPKPLPPPQVLGQPG